MPPHEVIVADTLHQAGWEALRRAQDVRARGPFDNREALLAALPQADALIVRSDTLVDEELLLAGRRLKMVARAGARLDNVDVACATARGVMVLNVPDANVTALVEHTFALLLGLARRIASGVQAIQAGQWSSHGLQGFELSGKLLGVIGFGRIGQEVAARAQAFGMRVLAYDPYMDLAYARDRRIEVADFEELLARADILSLHTALTSQTENLLNASSLACLKRGAILINCHHPRLIDEPALLEALEQGLLAGAALDGLVGAPPAPDHPLLSHPQVLLSPQLGQATVEAETRTDTQIIDELLDALRGQDYRNVVNLPFTPSLPYTEIKPYLHLATRLGKLQGQLAEGWIVRLEVETLGKALQDLVRPVTAALLSGMLHAQDGRPVNWVSAPPLAHEQGIAMAQAKGLVELDGYSNVVACRVYWAQGAGALAAGQRTVAGVLFGDGEARLLQYDHYRVDAKPEGFVLILENRDMPGVIGKVGTRLGRAGINIAHWRYGREASGKRAVSFINLDSRPPEGLTAELEKEPEILRARLVVL